MPIYSHMRRRLPRYVRSRRHLPYFFGYPYYAGMGSYHRYYDDNLRHSYGRNPYRYSPFGMGITPYGMYPYMFFY